MALLLQRQIDVAEAMIYNEYAQVLEAINPDTGELYQPEDLNVIDYNDEGTAMLQDALFARKAWLDQEGNEDVATRFLEASFRGWIFCRDNPDKCIEYTVDQGSTLGAGHQAWMMNEINPLIWPSPNGIGMMDKALWDQTVAVSIEAGIIPEAPPAEAYRTDLAEAALAEHHRRRHEGRGLHEGDRRGHRGRQLATRHDRRRKRAGPIGPALTNSAADSRGAASRFSRFAPIRSPILAPWTLPTHGWPISSDFPARARLRGGLRRLETVVIGPCHARSVHAQSARRSIRYNPNASIRPRATKRAMSVRVRRDGPVGSGGLLAGSFAEYPRADCAEGQQYTTRGPA